MTATYFCTIIAVFSLTFLFWVNVFTGAYHRRGWAYGLLLGEAFIAASCITFIFHAMR